MPEDVLGTEHPPYVGPGRPGKEYSAMGMGNAEKKPVGCSFKIGDVIVHKASLTRMVVMSVSDEQARSSWFRPINPQWRWLVNCRFFYDNPRRDYPGRRHAGGVFETGSFWDFELELAPGEDRRRLRDSG